MGLTLQARYPGRGFAKSVSSASPHGTDLKLEHCPLSAKPGLGRPSMLKRLILAGALACSCAGAAIATPIPAASTALIREALVVQAKVGRRHTPAGHVRRPYVIVLAMGALVGLIATTVMAD